ncbi:MAG: formylglycine-generating enzyme family protein [Pirellulaceae bacterium]
MPKIYQILLMLLLAGCALACVAIGFAQQQGVFMVGGLAALLCLAGLAAPRPRGKTAAQRALTRLFRRPENGAPGNEHLAENIPALTEGNGEGSLVDQMFAQGRYALLLRPEIAANLTRSQLQFALEALDAAMAVVPEGSVVMRSSRADDVAEVDRHKVEKLIALAGYYLDRFAVTNREYQKFVDAGGYEQLQLWDEAIWPAMLQFTDRSGQSGPRMWENGRYPAGKEDHPVVGVSWFEASAYARWTGKRLASDAEWVKAAAWPVTTEGSRLMQRKFPWGDAMDRSLANLWGSGPGDTVPVTKHAEGASVGGVQQLVGNVWEWTSTNFGAWEPPSAKLLTDIPLKSLRGGAFDTYFEAQAQCQFQSGDSPLARKHNIGFRCAVGFSDVANFNDLEERLQGDAEMSTDEIHEPGDSPADSEGACVEEVLS